MTSPNPRATSESRKLVRKKSLSHMKDIASTLRNITNPLEEDQELYETMEGNIQNLPPKTTKVVRIFLSSTFSDMAAERNIIMENIYPALKEFCRDRYGIEFQIIDMRWGVRDESQLDHQGPQLCYQELENCQKLSAGPSFITILGQRYGGRPPPATLSQADFVLLNDVLLSLNEDVSILEQWYRCDNNHIPPVYVLRPIVESSEHDLNTINKAKEEWWQAEKIILNKMDLAIHEGMKSGKISQEHGRMLQSSVTENEIRRGVLHSTLQARKLCGAFLRIIKNMDKQLHHPLATKFIDLHPNSNPPEINSNFKYLMDSLRDKILPEFLSTTNIKSYDIPWSDKGIQIETHKSYLEQFSKDFYEMICRLIERGISYGSRLSQNLLFTEVLQHLHACVNYVKHFQGRKEILDEIKAYLFSSNQAPLVVHGASGSGKTSVLAKAASQVMSWYKEYLQEQQADSVTSTSVLLLRFLGTSPGTSSIRRTLHSLCRQMAHLMSEEEMKTVDTLDEFKTVVNTFYSFVGKLASSEKYSKVFVFLDSIDQLDHSNGAYNLSWLRTSLPRNVRMVVSTLPDLYGILDRCYAKMPVDKYPQNYVQVLPMRQDLCFSILKSLLMERNRTLNEQQWQIVTEAFEKCSLPIYVNLIFYQVLAWKSFTSSTADDALHIEPTIRGAIFQLFAKMEKKHGKELTSRSLAYITASRNGLSETELEDLLSLDDVVLSDVFQFHLPTSIRIPPFLWVRLRQDIGSYLVEREADNTRVVYWYHRQFIEVAVDYFLSDKKFREEIHSNLADYFLGIWSGGKKKEFVYPEYIAKKMNLGKSILVDRRVPSQPYVFEEQTIDDKSVSVRYNLRKLNELPLHLVRANRLSEFYDYLAFDYEFLFNKMRATSRLSLLQDLQLLETEGCTEIIPELSLLTNALRISTHSLIHDPAALCVDLVGRLYDFEATSPRIHLLLEQCRTIAREDCILLPVHQCFDSGSDILHTSFDLEIGIGFIMPNNQMLVFSLLNTELKWFDMDGNEVSSVFSRDNLFMTLKYLTNRKLPEDMKIINCYLTRTSQINKDTDHEQEMERKWIELEARAKAAGMTMEEFDPEAMQQLERETVEKELEGKTIQCGRVDYTTGNVEPLFNLDDELSEAAGGVKWSMENIETVTDNYIQYSERNGGSKAFLIRIKDKKIMFEKVKGLIGSTHISDCDRYFYYYDKDTGNLRIMNLSTETWHEFKSDPVIGIACLIDHFICLIQTADNNSLKIVLIDIPSDGILPENLSSSTEYLIETPDEYKYKTKYLQSFTSPSKDYVMFLTKSSSSNPWGLIYNRQKREAYFLKRESALGTLEKKYTENFGDGSQCGFMEKLDLVLTSGSKCLLIAWDLCTGEFLHLFKNGSAEGFIAGNPVGTDLFFISHFPNEEGTDNERMFITAKVYNMAALRRQTSAHVANAQNKDENKLTEKKTVFPEYRPKCILHQVPNEDNLIVLYNKENETQHLIDIDLNSISVIDTPMSQKNIHASLYYSSQIPDLDNNELLLTVYNNENQVVASADKTENVFCQVAKSKVNHFFKEAKVKKGTIVYHNKRNLILLRINTASYALEITVDDNKNGNEVEHVEKNLKTIEIFSFIENSEMNAEQRNWILTESNAKLKVGQVLVRPAHEDQMIVVWVSSDDMDDLLKVDKKFCICPGGTTILDFSALNSHFHEDSIQLLHHRYWDITKDVQALNDGMHIINYRLQILHLEKGEIIRQITPNVIFISLLLTPDESYVVGQRYIQPAKVEFDVFDEDESQSSDMYATVPARCLEVYEVKTGKRFGSYMFENEPTELLMFTKANENRFIECFVAAASLFENLRVFKINVSGGDRRPATRASRRQVATPRSARPTQTATKIRQSNKTMNGPKPSYLTSIGVGDILSKALLEIVERRPRDPIEYLSLYLRKNSK